MVRPVKTYDSVTERSFILVLLFFFVWLIDWIIISKQNQHTAVFQALTPTWYNLSEVDIFTWQQPHITFIYSSTTLVLFQHAAGFVFFSGVTHFPPANQQQRRSSTAACVITWLITCHASENEIEVSRLACDQMGQHVLLLYNVSPLIKSTVLYQCSWLTQCDRTQWESNLKLSCMSAKVTK